MKDKEFNSETGNKSNQDSQANNSNQESQIDCKTAAFTKSNDYRDENYIHYSYKIVNKITGKYYIGIHSFPKDLGYKPENDGYWGSGTKIQEAIRKEGKENFKKEVLKLFSTRQELSDEEKKLVTIKEVNDPMCYNSTLGGDDNFESNIGWVICRPKSAIDKIIKISREEYYRNKNLYVPTGHIKYYLTRSETRSVNTITNNKKWSQKIDETDTFYNRRRDFVNKNTLEIKTFVGHNEPDKLYDEWFPIYFYDKSNNCFITKEYFEEEYKKLPNIEKLSVKFKIARKYVRKLRDYYISKGSILNESNKQRKPHSNRGSGFSGKTFVNKDNKTIVINKTELQGYLNKGYKPGKYTQLNKIDVYNFYIAGNSLRKTAEKFSTTNNKIKEILELTDNSSTMWFHNDSRRESIHLLVKDSKMKDDILKNGWVEGKRIYKTPSNS